MVPTAAVLGNRSVTLVNTWIFALGAEVRGVGCTRKLSLQASAPGMNSPASGPPGGCQELPNHAMEQEFLSTKVLIS